MKSQTKPPEFLLVVFLVASVAGVVGGVTEAIWGEWPEPARRLVLWALFGLFLKWMDSAWTWPKTAVFIVTCFIAQHTVLWLEAQVGLSRAASGGPPWPQGYDWLIITVLGGGGFVLVLWAIMETAKALNYVFRR